MAEIPGPPEGVNPHEFENQDTGTNVNVLNFAPELTDTQVSAVEEVLNAMEDSTGLKLPDFAREVGSTQDFLQKSPWEVRNIEDLSGGPVAVLMSEKGVALSDALEVLTKAQGATTSGRVELILAKEDNTVENYSLGRVERSI